MRVARAPHGLRGSQLPQHRRVLEPRHGDLHDPRRHLHAVLRLLQRHARGRRSHPTPTSPSRSAAPSPPSPSTTSSSPRSTAMTLPDCGASHLRRRRSPRRGPGSRRAASKCSSPTSRATSRRCASCSTRGPDVLNHNIETVPRLYRTARPGGRYDRALEVLDRSRTYAPSIPTKSGLMVGLGEEWDEVVATLRDLRDGGLPDRHDRSVPAAVARQPPDGALLHAGGVRRAEANGARDGLRPRASQARSSAARTMPTSRRSPSGARHAVGLR